MSAAFKSDLVDLELAFHSESHRAILVSTDGEIDGRVWLPKSQIEFEQLPRDRVSVTLPQWLAEERRLV